MNYPPPLPREEQIALCLKAQQGDLRARDRLVTTTMRMVVARAHALRKISPSAELEDLVSAGSLGVMRAIEKYDAAMGFAFVTYAQPWIDHYVRSAVNDARGMTSSVAWRGVKVAKAYRAALAEGADHEGAVERISLATGILPRTVTDLVDAMRRGVDKSLDAPLSSDGDMTLGSMVADDQTPADEVLVSAERVATMKKAIARFRGELDERERAILDRRLLVDDEDAETLRELGDVFGISRERIRQIEVQLTARLHERLKRRFGLSTFDRVAWARQWWMKRKARGLCYCGLAAKPGYVTCGTHKKSREEYRANRAAALARGKCPTHTAAALEPGTTRCALCNERKRECAKRKRAERRAAGMCQLCGRAADGKPRCDECKKTRHGAGPGVVVEQERAA